MLAVTGAIAAIDYHRVGLIKLHGIWTVALIAAGAFLILNWPALTPCVR